MALDRFTSMVIRHGGTLRSPHSRKALDSVSPYLAKRTLGHHAVPIHEELKAIFDPNDILTPNR